MPVDIIEVANFDPGPIVVPLLTDSMDDSALVVAAFVQQLTNRSAYLKQQTDDGPSLTAPNTFTGTNTFNAAVDINAASTFDAAMHFRAATDFLDMLLVNNANADRPILQADLGATSSPVSGNKWKHVFHFRAGSSAAGPQYFDAFAGSDGATVGTWMMTINAYWDSVAQLWRARDTAKTSQALCWKFDGIYVLGIPTGIPSWPAWADSTSPNLLGTLHAGYLNTTYVIADAIQLNPLADGVDFSGVIADRQRTLMIDLADHTLIGGSAGSQLTYGSAGIANSVAGPTNNVVSIPVRLPNGASITNIQFSHKQISNVAGSANRFSLVKKTSGAWDPTMAQPAVTFPYNAVEDSSALGVPMVTTLSGATGTIIDNPLVSYNITVQLPLSGSILYAVRLTFVDPGPRNN